MSGERLLAGSGPQERKDSTLSKASVLLEIDQRRAVEMVTRYIVGHCDQHSASGALIGLSGGIDSAVLATLAVHALGRDAVHVSYLSDRDSERDLALNARQMADLLGLELEVENIQPAMREQGIYRSWIMRVTYASRLATRALFRLYGLALGETPFVSSLRAGSGEMGSSSVQRSNLEAVNHFAELSFYARSRYRREVLERKATAQNWLLLGAANRSEWMVGWFVVDGVDDVPYQPIIGLYKTQVRQLAAFLGVPAAIRSQAPSPDMMKGVTDEFALGISYAKIDVVLDYLEGGLSSGDLNMMGITERDLALVSGMKRLSSWKRKDISMPCSADGGPSGSLRMPQ